RDAIVRPEDGAAAAGEGDLVALRRVLGEGARPDIADPGAGTQRHVPAPARLPRVDAQAGFRFAFSPRRDQPVAGKPARPAFERYAERAEQRRFGAGAIEEHVRFQPLATREHERRDAAIRAALDAADRTFDAGDAALLGGGAQHAAIGRAVEMIAIVEGREDRAWIGRREGEAAELRRQRAERIFLQLARAAGPPHPEPQIVEGDAVQRRAEGRERPEVALARFRPA